MKSISLIAFVAVLFTFSSCETVQQITNTTTTGSVFSINGKWQLNSNSLDNTLINSVVTVTPFIAEGRFTYLANNNQCYRENDIKWKNLKANKNGGYTLESASSNCNSGSLTYSNANIDVVNNNEIRLVGRNATGSDYTQSWVRIK